MSDTQTALRKVGKNGPKVPAIGFGSMGLSIAYGAIGSVSRLLCFAAYTNLKQL